MPAGNKRGPDGEGPKTGRGLGYCSGNDHPGFEHADEPRGIRYGSGRGLGRGMGRRARAAEDPENRAGSRGLGLGMGRGGGRGKGRGRGRV